MSSVAIIGGGITGLVAAFRLQQRGLDVTVYEAGPRVGGVIQSVRQNGYLAEFGPNTILETSPKISALVKDLGLESRRLYTDPKAEARYLVRYGRPIEMSSSPLGFMTSPLFSTGAKFSLLREVFVRKGDPAVDESLADFVRRRIGPEFLDYAINPMVAGIYAGDPERLSVREAFPKLHALEQRYGSLLLGQVLGARARKKSGEISKQTAKKFSFDEGLRVLTDTLAGKLGERILLSTPVRHIEATTAGWRVDAQADGRPVSREHFCVLFATPTHRLKDMQVYYPGVPSLRPLAEIKYPPVTSVVLGFRREDVAHPASGFGVLIPAVEGFQILGTIFSSALFPNRAPAGHVVLSSYVGGSRNPELALLEKSKLREVVLKDLGKLLGVKGAPTFEHYAVYPKAIPQYEVGYGQHRALMDEMEAKAPGFFLAGHFRDGIALGDSILSGEKAAGKIATYLSEGKLPSAPKTASSAP